MNQIQIDDAIAHFKEIVAKGEQVTVMQGGTAVAEISPVVPEKDRLHGFVLGEHESIEFMERIKRIRSALIGAEH